jgi:hypothetical protein
LSVDGGVIKSAFQEHHGMARAIPAAFFVVIAKPSKLFDAPSPSRIIRAGKSLPALWRL